MGAIKPINLDKILKANEYSLVDFYATWCGPCQMLSPVIEKVMEDFPKIKLVKINVDEQPELAQEYDVQSIPTVFLFKQTTEINSFKGFRDQNNLTAWIRQHIKSA
ncbi:MAG: thioredoxin [Mycoplasmataceae bacterium]|nr:thioredoxin [Mycoplasmataceae bacterium]